MKIKSIRQVKGLAGKTILVRCDFNIALNKNKLVDDYKIIKSLPTIRLLTSQKAKVILMTHLGRPAGKKVTSCKLTPVSNRLSKLLGKKVVYVDDCVGKKAQSAVEKLKDGQVLLLENLRFYPGETNNNKKFAKQLAGLADLYVNNAMAVSHRAHASVSAIKKYLSSYAGLLLEQEVRELSKLNKPARPFVVVMGGEKIATKFPLLKVLRKKASHILIGGLLSYDFLAAKKLSTGKFKVSKSDKKLAKKLLSKKIVTPVDFVVSSQKSNAKKVEVVASDSIPKGSWQFDIGPATVREYAAILKKAKTIIWNGPMGMYEQEQFKHGTIAIARLVASHGTGRACVIVGGGETIAALKQSKMMDHVDWVSTSGGAMLTYLAGGKMPGLSKIVR